MYLHTCGAHEFTRRLLAIYTSSILQLGMQTLAYLGSLVDKPISESSPVNLCTRVIKDILHTRIDWTTIALLNALAIDWVRFSSARVFWRLLLVL